MSDQSREVQIRFEDLSPAEAGLKARTLRRELQGLSPDVSFELRKDDPENQDFGATLILLLGTPAIIAVAQGIASYLKRDRGTITVLADGKTVATGISGDDAARIVEALSTRPR